MIGDSWSRNTVEEAAMCSSARLTGVADSHGVVEYARSYRVDAAALRRFRAVSASGSDTGLLLAGSSMRVYWAICRFRVL